MAGVGALAAYCARQASVHRESATYCRQLGNDLAILPAFLADLSPEDQSEVKKRVAIARFAAPLGMPTTKSSDESGPGIMLTSRDLLDALLKAKS